MAKAAVMIMLEPIQVEVLQECCIRESRSTSALARMLIIEALQKRGLLDSTGLSKLPPKNVEA